MVYGQYKAIEEVGSAQDEQRSWTVGEEATDLEICPSNSDRQMPQSCHHTSLFDSHHLGLRECIPLQADLLG